MSDHSIVNHVPNKDAPDGEESQWQPGRPPWSNANHLTAPYYVGPNPDTRFNNQFGPTSLPTPFPQPQPPVAALSPYPVWQMSNAGDPHSHSYPNPNPSPYSNISHPNAAAPRFPVESLPPTVINRTPSQMPNVIVGATHVQDGNPPCLTPQVSTLPGPPPPAPLQWQGNEISSAADTPNTPLPSISPMPSNWAGPNSAGASDQKTNDYIDESDDLKEKKLFSEDIAERLVTSLKAATASRNNGNKIIPPDLVRAMSGNVSDQVLDSRTLVLKRMAAIYNSHEDHDAGSKSVLEYLQPLWEEQLAAWQNTAACLYYSNQYSCRKCEVPDTICEFWDHLFPDHGAADIMPLKCLFCESQFNVPAAWEEHLMGCYNLTIFLVSQLKYVWQVSMVRNFLMNHLTERMKKFRVELEEEYKRRFN